ncbi:Gfo/Idh/MocA family protein [Thalassobacillus pellis]|uniref:Gfo/Idh/MocA family protein n=1 Tax=Thalassobacillus pellis TaxID=748008 RepID=UPI0019611F63|nr:Gfo/Idh/MocA family oxidoreductase [Thalassobacillus pellis]MBM7551571.1 putative dehydrogenase [Thalassobacillus pellis]
MNIGVIGYGLRASHVIKELQQCDPSCEITAITEINQEAVKEKLGDEAENISFYKTPEEMLEDQKLDGIIIGTRCDLHTEMAMKVFPSNIPIFLEKPVAINHQQLLQLKKANEKYKPQVVVSFPLRFTPILKHAKALIEEGKLGTIEHVQATNNVTYGTVYFQNWYRNEEQTGGLFLQKATHDFDYINYLLDLKPTRISAMESKQIFTGDKPASLKCVDCSEQDTCLESAVLKRKKGEVPQGEYCCFAEDTGNHDSASALIQYETGMHVSYSQNFFVRKKAGVRGARLMGHKGTMEFDFYKNKLSIYQHHTDIVETHEIDTEGKTHFGGDSALVQNFIEVMKGGKAVSKSPLEDGLLSGLMCMKARDSVQNGRFEKINFE